MKTLQFTIICLISIIISNPAESQNQPDELKSISMMIVQGKSKTEIIKAWESVVTRNPKIDVDKAISSIINTARQENSKKPEALRKTSQQESSSQSGGTMESIITDLQKQMHDTAKKIIDNLKS